MIGLVFHLGFIAGFTVFARITYVGVATHRTLTPSLEIQAIYPKGSECAEFHVAASERIVSW